MVETPFCLERGTHYRAERVVGRKVTLSPQLPLKTVGKICLGPGA